MSEALLVGGSVKVERSLPERDHAPLLERAFAD